jgi:hypothetical protein
LLPGNPKALQLAAAATQWGCTKLIEYYEERTSSGGGGPIGGDGHSTGPNPAETVPKVGGGYWQKPESIPVDTPHFALKLEAHSDSQAGSETFARYGADIFEPSVSEHSVHLIGVAHAIV